MCAATCANIAASQSGELCFAIAVAALTSSSPSHHCVIVAMSSSSSKEPHLRTRHGVSAERRRAADPTCASMQAVALPRCPGDDAGATPPQATSPSPCAIHHNAPRVVTGLLCRWYATDCKSSPMLAQAVVVDQGGECPEVCIQILRQHMKSLVGARRASRVLPW